MTAIAWVLGIALGLFLLFRFPRQMGILLAAILALAAAAAGLWWLSAQQASRDQASVAAAVRFDEKLCADPKWPLFVSLENNSARTVSNTSFNLQGRRHGFSSLVINDYWSTDRIIEPGGGWGMCLPLNKYSMDDSKGVGLEWAVEVTGVTFR